MFHDIIDLIGTSQTGGVDIKSDDHVADQSERTIRCLQPFVACQSESDGGCSGATDTSQCTTLEAVQIFLRVT